jgi:glycerol-3-phosphate dehydrogenase
MFKGRRGEIKTLAEEFVYPRLGATLAANIVKRGSTVATGAKVTHFRREDRCLVAAQVPSEEGG